MAEDFKFIGAPITSQDGTQDDQDRFLVELRNAVYLCQKTLVGEGLGGAGPGSRGVYLRDPDELTAIEAPAAQLYNGATTGGFEVVASNTAGFWNLIDNQGFKVTGDWTANQWRTICDLTDCRGVIGYIITPQRTTADATVTIEVTLDTTFIRIRTFTHQYTGDSTTRIVWISGQLANFGSLGGTATVMDSPFDGGNASAQEDTQIIFDTTAGAENIHYSSTEFFRLMTVMELQRRGMATLSFTRNCRIRMQVNENLTAGVQNDYAGVHMLAHRLIQ